ncbi:MAG: sulfur transferase domain-containing protein [Pseudomonadales bacterium]|jgi:uncharacterized protein (TIGR01244 family)|nr:sulfur transferase domain-containing protein [Pseudomonadales bacterium]MDP6470133.1 sulfur transferase domain-containing protein [Pseudomonadales bacterium]MDP6827039.1 sulfur transferase domain-containing protein [Pseudomonadales bacterium]MDP6972604.1 sulfur transferase domain-containing protein [Pseudomonadales bacterium]|tara:strand:+ start:295 stop:870 length:576 start_codon:yes stop_codon:yes gene_type:complete
MALQHILIIAVFATFGLAGTAGLHAGELPQKLNADGFGEVLAVSGSTYIAGQPTKIGLDRMKQAGVTTVVNLRTHMEMNNRDVVPFDEAAYVDELGLEYVHIPLGGPGTPYNPGAVKTFAAAMEKAQGRVLLHCTVAWRASHLWTAYLVRNRGMAIEEAVRHGQAINLGTLPLEQFLDRPLTIQYRESQPQ